MFVTHIQKMIARNNVGTFARSSTINDQREGIGNNSVDCNLYIQYSCYIYTTRNNKYHIIIRHSILSSIVSPNSQPTDVLYMYMCARIPNHGLTTCTQWLKTIREIPQSTWDTDTGCAVCQRVETTAFSVKSTQHTPL